jgi:hypothetical protein
MLSLHPFLWLILVLVPSFLSIGLWATSPPYWRWPIVQLSVLDTLPCAPYSLCSLLSYDLDLCKRPPPAPAHSGHLQHIPSCKRCAIALSLYVNILIKNIGWVSAKATMLATAATGGGGNRYAELTSHGLVYLMEVESGMRPSGRSSTPRYPKD